MKKALNLIFWGYVLALLRVDIGIDILPDPIGYIMIANGCNKLYRSFTIAKFPRTIAVALIFISIPTLIVDVNQVTTIGWLSYAFVLAIGQLILVYYLFRLLKAMIQENAILIKRIDNTFIVYMIVNFIVLMHMSFSMNLPDHTFQTIGIVIILTALVMEIVFLVLINSIKREVPDELIINNL